MNSEMVRCEIEATGLTCEKVHCEIEAGGTQPLKNKKICCQTNYLKTKCILQSIGWRITCLRSCFNIKRW